MNDPKRMSLAEFSKLHLRSLVAPPLQENDKLTAAAQNALENSVALHIALGMSKVRDLANFSELQRRLTVAPSLGQSARSS
jgi:hypothetical protein